MSDLAGITIPVNTSQIAMGIAQTAKLEAQLVKLERARRKGIISDQQFASSLATLSKRMNRFTNDTAAAEAEVKRFGNSLAQLDAKGLNNVGRGLGDSTKGFARFGLAAQQSGYQIGDFFVQIASGTSPIVAFTQQFSQLAGFFGGPWGAVVGAIAAIGGAAYIAFSSASNEVDKFQESLDNLKKSTEDMKFEVQVSIGGFDNEEQKKLYDEIRVKGQEILNLEKEREILAQSGSRLTASMLYAKDQEIAKANEILNQTQEQLRANQEAVKELEKENAIVDLIAEGLDRAAIKGLELSGIDFSNLSDAAVDVGILATNMGIAVEEAAKIRLQQGQLDRLNQNAGRGSTSSEPVQWGDGTAIKLEKPTKGKSGGGGVNQAEQLLSAYNALMGSLDPLVAAQNQYNNSLETLDKALAKGVISQEQYKAGLAGITQKLREAQDPLNSFKQNLEDALDPNKNYIKGLQGLQNSLSEFLFNPFEVGLQGMVYGFSRSLQKMASDALAAGFIKMLLGGGGFGASGGIGSSILSFLSPNANGNAFNQGNVVPFANGGVFGSPTTFPMAGGKTGLMGEAGPEAIMPLKRGSDGKLGVSTDGGARTTKIINVLNPAIVGEYLNTSEGEEVIMNVMRRTGVV